MDYGPLAATLLAVAGLVSVLAAVLIAVRNARSKGRRAALGEADEVERLLSECRAARLADQQLIYDLQTALIERGIKLP